MRLAHHIHAENSSAFSIELENPKCIARSRKEDSYILDSVCLQDKKTKPQSRHKSRVSPRPESEDAQDRNLVQKKTP